VIVDITKMKHKGMWLTYILMWGFTEQWKNHCNSLKFKILYFCNAKLNSK